MYTAYVSEWVRNTVRERTTQGTHTQRDRENGLNISKSESVRERDIDIERDMRVCVRVCCAVLCKR